MTDPDSNIRSRRFGLSTRTAITLGALATLAIGGVAGTMAGHAMRPSIEMAPLKPVAIRSLAAGDSLVTIRGRIAEVFGNKLVVDDGSARALVDTGPEGDDKALAAVGAPVTVQGHFDHGFVRASFLVDATGKVTALGPMHGPHDRDRRHGGPDRDGAPRPGEGPPPPRPGDAPPPPPQVATPAG